MTEWFVGFRDGWLIEHTVRSAESAMEAADVVRSERPRSLIVAVIHWPAVSSVHEPIEYSDLPNRYRELRRYNGPIADHHGYMVVSSSADGSRASIPNRPISLEQARWHRDWMLRGYFEALHRHLQNRRCPAPHVPEIVQLQVLDEQLAKRPGG